MIIPKKIVVAGSLVIVVVTAVAGIKPTAAPDAAFKNLQVLPSNISAGLLNKIMIDQFEDDLGVSCNFCHAENKDTHKPDYASDEKPEKQLARKMMQMTIGINEKYFDHTHPMIGDTSLVITCGTCHKGSPIPGEAAGE